MNLVFGSIFLFILIIPGLAFRYSYLHGTYTKQSFKISAVDEIFWAIVPALIFQLAGIIIIENLTPYQVKLELVYKIITDSGTINFALIRSSLLYFSLYLLTMIGIAVVLGLLVRQLVRKFRWDLKYPPLRLNNEWYYLFSGEILDLEKPGESKNIDLIQVDVLMQTGEGPLVYSGTLKDYFLSRENGLDRIYLSQVYRRKMQDDLTSNQPNVGYLERYLDARYYSMPGDLFVITYDKILNINITYHVWSNILEDEVNENE
ncbi:hypothetical protein [Ohtaekwangia sp.]|uniref:hypothetical protein n=1 Tax=Ohtaekwangia sp. TaxID=2066019 RepID=UPI002F93829E